MHTSAALSSGLNDLDIQIERERRRRLQRQLVVTPVPRDPADFLARTKIEVQASAAQAALVPFVAWPRQRDVLNVLQRDQLIVFLKARQLGISWLLCGFALAFCTQQTGQSVLMLSQGQLEANELIRRVSLMYHHHEDKALLPAMPTDNTGDLAWSNGSRIISLAATKRAGRTFTAAKVILDEWAFMQWPRETLAAVKPTIDAGGQLIIISTADGYGSAYHQFWQAAASGANGYTPIFLPWTARPDRGPGWRDQKIIEASGDRVSVLREYPENDIEAFQAASGIVYAVWSDGPDDGNVTEAAEYQPGDQVIWGVDDGYAGKRDASGEYTDKSHPRVFLLAQIRGDGHICVFYEHYATETLSEDQLNTVLALDYTEPDYAAIDSSAAELRGRIHDQGIQTVGATHSVDEGIKELRAGLAPDSNGWRRVLVHPRCTHLRAEMQRYRVDDNGKPVKAYDHGPDALRYLYWTQRHSL